MLFLNVEDEFHVSSNCRVVRWEAVGRGSDSFPLVWPVTHDVYDLDLGDFKTHAFLTTRLSDLTRILHLIWAH